MKKSPYQVVKFRYISEKASLLESLKDVEGSRSIARCQTPKCVFVVDPNASKGEIARAVEEIYADDNVKVIAVNTINVKPKRKRSRNRQSGFKSGFKKAIVTFQAGDIIKE